MKMEVAPSALLLFGGANTAYITFTHLSRAHLSISPNQHRHLTIDTRNQRPSLSRKKQAVAIASRQENVMSSCIRTWTWSTPYKWRATPTPGFVFLNQNPKFVSRCDSRTVQRAPNQSSVADSGLDTARLNLDPRNISRSFSFVLFERQDSHAKKATGGLVGPHAFSSPHTFPTAPPLIRHLLPHAVTSIGLRSATYDFTPSVIDGDDATFHVSISGGSRFGTTFWKWKLSV